MTSVMEAGAGSGKTMSLVKALAHLVAPHSQDLHMRGQQIARVIHTKVTTNEIGSSVRETSPQVRLRKFCLTALMIIIIN
ncbi:UvrD-helicase domain-containing protein [Aliidongia dinghuensis]|uniref:UvrD-helicase domain-containing protein n=1 Tax=Aliidongia dinghuensis TaxID=1867774 RepID=UPI00166995C7|nr:UvrD-helicase domain-containing protein [Aliidongia dinghuensis]